MEHTPLEQILGRALDLRQNKTAEPDPFDTLESVRIAMREQGYPEPVILRKYALIGQALRFVVRGHY